ncbi:amino acid transporter AVT1J-like isoform X2 [Cucurbita moschata]|uniref:Amino acid transporter AVT1J-like isoform X2 n=1 Tax=Cucurbita moschata TaxID=3662 RepID=A0A6J1H1R5_CUCMO|nr:amino acid transporter AVT1J-like isoform X2 [Cucurbita moschata]
METQSQLPSTQLQLKGTTFLRTCINGINALSAVCWYTGLLLKRCMDANPSVRTYPDIGWLAFGFKGKIMVSVFVYMELYLVAVEFLILEGDNLQKLFPSSGFKVGSVSVEGKQMYMVLAAVFILPTTWLKSLGLLAYVSFGGVLASVVLVLCVAWVGAVDGVGFNQRNELLKLQGLPTTLSLFLFCYCGHAVFPMLSNSMNNKTQFPKVLMVCFVTSTMSYGSMAILGYLMYGDNIKSQVTLNLPTDKTSTKVAIYTTLINPITKYAAIINPIAIAIEEASRLFATRSMAILMRTLLLFTTLILALSIPFFAYVMAFTGAFLSVTNGILIPCLCYLKINKSARKFGWELVVIVGILVMGFSVGILGTCSSIKEIVKRL